MTSIARHLVTTLTTIVLSCYTAAVAEEPRRVRFGHHQPVLSQGLRNAQDFLEKYTGLVFLEQPPIEFINREDYKKRLNEEMDKDREKFLHQVRIYQALGLFPPGSDVEGAVKGVISGAATGYYDVRKHKLFLIQDDSGARVQLIDQATLVHELHHALMDQHGCGAEMISDDPGLDADETFGRVCWFEGQARLAEEIFAREWLNGRRAVPSAETLRQLLAWKLFENRELYSSRKLSTVGGLVEADLHFPYQWGNLRVLTEAQRNLDRWHEWQRSLAMPGRAPRSTENILTGLSGQEDGPEPIDLDLAFVRKWLEDHPGWKVMETSARLGEFMLRVWLRRGGLDRPDPDGSAALGWRGDRLLLVSSENGRAVTGVLVVAFDTETEAITAQAAFQARLNPNNLDAPPLAERSGNLVVCSVNPACPGEFRRAAVEAVASVTLPPARPNRLTLVRIWAGLGGRAGDAAAWHELVENATKVDDHGLWLERISRDLFGARDAGDPTSCGASREMSRRLATGVLDRPLGTAGRKHLVESALLTLEDPKAAPLGRTNALEFLWSSRGSLESTQWQRLGRACEAWPGPHAGDLARAVRRAAAEHGHAEAF